MERKAYFTDGLLQIAIVLSLFRTDWNSHVGPSLYDGYPEIQEIIMGPLSGYAQAYVHANEWHSGALGASHPKAVGADYAPSVFHDVHGLGRYWRFDRTRTDIDAFLVSEVPVDLERAHATSQGHLPAGDDPAAVASDSSSGHPSQDEQGEQLGLVSPLVEGAVGPEVEQTGPYSFEFPASNLTKEDMDLIEILWRQDIDLGVDRDAFDSSQRLALEKQRENELVQHREKEKELEKKRDEPKTEESQNVTFVLDRETGELIPAPLEPESSLPSDSFVPFTHQQLDDLPTLPENPFSTQTHQRILQEQPSLLPETQLEQQLLQLEQQPLPEEQLLQLEQQPLPEEQLLQLEQQPLPEQQHLQLEQQPPPEEQLLQLEQQPLPEEQLLQLEQQPLPEEQLLQLEQQPLPEEQLLQLEQQPLLPEQPSVLPEQQSVLVPLQPVVPEEQDLALLPNGNFVEQNWDDISDFLHLGETNDSSNNTELMMNELTKLLEENYMPAPNTTDESPLINNATLASNMEANDLSFREEDSNVAQPVNQEAMEALSLMSAEVLGLSGMAETPSSDYVNSTATLLEHLLRDNVDVNDMNLTYGNASLETMMSPDSAISSGGASVDMDASDVRGQSDSPYDALEGATGGSDIDSTASYEAAETKHKDMQEFADNKITFDNQDLYLNHSDGSNASISVVEREADPRKVCHNHTYPLQPGKSPRETRSQKLLREEMEMHDAQYTRDEKRAKAMNIPLTMDEMISTPVEHFNELLQNRQFTDAQLQLIRDIRRRGKNKVAAQNCRKRKLRVLQTLEEEVERMKRERDQLRAERHGLDKEMSTVRQKYSQLYDNVFRNLIDSEGQPYDPNQYVLQQNDDGELFLIPQNATSCMGGDKPKTKGSRKRKHDRKRH